MPRVRILPAIQYTSYDHTAGDEVDLPADVAATWCHAGLAKLVRGQALETPETAGDDAAPETTSAPAATRRARTRKS